MLNVCDHCGSYRVDKQVLDLGTGTGILSLVAVKLGAERVIAVDNDPGAALNTHENAVLNNARGRISIVLGEMNSLQDVTFDLILANIYTDIILDHAERICGFADGSGTVLLSGITLHRNYDVRMKYNRLLRREPVRNRMMEDYSTILYSGIRN